MEREIDWWQSQINKILSCGITGGIFAENGQIFILNYGPLGWLRLLGLDGAKH